MNLYHASQHTFSTIERRQAQHTEPEAFAVPDTELQNKIYFSPDIGFAIAMAAGPDGMTSLRNGQVSFEHDEQFDGERPVYVYEIDSASIAPELIENVDADQVAIDLDEITPAVIHEFKAKDVFEYYKHTKWVHPKEFCGG